MSIVIPFSKTPPSANGPSSPPAQVGPFELMAAAQMNELAKSAGGGSYIGNLGKDDDLSYDRTEAIGRRGKDGKVERSADPEKIMRGLPEDQEGYTLEDNPHLFIRKKKPGDKKPDLRDLVS